MKEHVMPGGSYMANGWLEKACKQDNLDYEKEKKRWDDYVLLRESPQCAMK